MTGTRTTRNRGFTLIEVLVAVAVLAITMGAFIAGGGRYADYARYQRDRTLALWVAQNRMAEYRLAPGWPDTGREEGRVSMGNQRWQWRAEISETPDPALRRINIEVYRIDPATGEPQKRALANLTGFVARNSSRAASRGRP